jgi:hypothetical protein
MTRITGRELRKIIREEISRSMDPLTDLDPGIPSSATFNPNRRPGQSPGDLAMGKRRDPEAFGAEDDEDFDSDSAAIQSVHADAEDEDLYESDRPVMMGRPMMFPLHALREAKLRRR